jgi:hypothetical protein
MTLFIHVNINIHIHVRRVCHEHIHWSPFLYYISYQLKKIQPFLSPLYTYIYIYICMYIHTYIYVCIYIYVYSHILMSLCINVWHVHIYICIYIYLYIYIYIYTCIYIFTGIPQFAHAKANTCIIMKTSSREFRDKYTKGNSIFYDSLLKFLYLHLYIYTYIYIYECIIWTHA